MVKIRNVKSLRWTSPDSKAASWFLIGWDKNLKKGIAQNSIVKKLINKKRYGLQADEQVDTGLMTD